MRIETSSIEIGSSATITDRLDRERARDRDALALAAGQLVRVLRGVLLAGGTSPTVSSSVAHALVELARVDTPVDPQRPREVVAHRLDRVQRAERVLEDHLHLASGTAARRAGAARRRRRCPSKSMLAGGRVVEAREHPRDGALAAAALADERGDRARAEREA